VTVTGTVTAFDERRGLGTISAEGVEHAFHCTQLVDGTRNVRAGERVEFQVVPGRRGDWEAAEIVKLG
jgi:cold shock CspA family protein